MKQIPSKTIIIKHAPHIEIDTKAELIGLFLDAYSHKILVLTEESQDNFQRVIDSSRTTFLLRAISSYYGIEFKMVDISLSL